jgi:hypothetical protein
MQRGEIEKERGELTRMTGERADDDSSLLYTIDDD